MEMIRMFIIEGVEPTDNDGWRVKITDNRYNEVITFDWDYDYHGVANNAIAYLEGLGITIDFQAEMLIDAVALFSRDFDIHLGGVIND